MGCELTADSILVTQVLRVSHYVFFVLWFAFAIPTVKAIKRYIFAIYKDHRPFLKVRKPLITLIIIGFCCFNYFIAIPGYAIISNLDLENIINYPSNIILRLFIDFNFLILGVAVFFFYFFCSVFVQFWLCANVFVCSRTCFISRENAMCNITYVQNKAKRMKKKT